MKHLIISILGTISLICLAIVSYGQNKEQTFSFEMYGDIFNMNVDSSIIVNFSLSSSEQSIRTFYSTIDAGNYKSVIDSLIRYKEKHQLNDWFYYQLVRKAAQQISPKADNYERYTLYKWFFLTKSGYDATLGIVNDKLLFYVRSDDDIFDIPFYMSNGQQYMSLNSHDYVKSDEDKSKIQLIDIAVPEATHIFSYKVTQVPNFRPQDYAEKDLEFSYGEQVYRFKLKLNSEVETIFINYPVVDFRTYFNIPLSQETYQSLIPVLRNDLKNMSQKQGVDYLMHFTRNAFLYKDDVENFGKEKRLSPEQTLFNDRSDCDDRAALFFYLVKEIYNLPMIALLYQTHITMAVQFDKPGGKTLSYNGKRYSVCEPTPQKQDLKIGQLSSKYQSLPYQVVYSYDPSENPGAEKSDQQAYNFQ